MDPALQELLEAGETTEEVAVVVRLRQRAEPPPGLRIVARLGPIATARVERAAIWQIYGHPAIHSLKAPRWLVSEYGPLIDREDAENVDASDSDQRRPDGLAQTGRGVLVGIIDWGCDFAHPDFVSEAGVSRIQALWDQRAAQADSNPYGYGRVLRREHLTAALKADDPYAIADYHPARSDTGVGAHGTHVMGIAIGNGRGGGPLGLAPQADCAFVHLGAPGWEKNGPLGDSSNLLEAIHFLVNEAGERPLVLNMSIGRHAGPHDGSTLVEQAIDWLVRARPGTAVVQSTGNYFSRNVHSTGQLINGEHDTLEFEVYAGDTTPNELEVWYPGRDVFGARLLAPDGREVASVKQSDKAKLLHDGARIGTLYHRARDPNNGDHHLNLFLYPNAPPGIWRLELLGEDISDGRYHAWLERDPGCRTCQSLFVPHSSDHTATTGSICNGMQTLAVGAYDAHHPDRPLAPFSSSGPTRDGRVRPLLLAPGVRILAARSHPRTGTAPLLTRMSGTSMAAPHVTGTVALMFEAGGRLDIVQLRRALFESLAATMPVRARDRHRIGFGVLDTAAAVERAAQLGAVATVPASPPTVVSGSPTAIAGAAHHAHGDALPASSEDLTMNADCCGDPCKQCEHCQDHDCATCPCCHDEHGAFRGHESDESSATIQVVPSPLEQFEADEPVVQIVPSPLGPAREDVEWDEAEAWTEADDPTVQVVPSPLEVSETDESDEFFTDGVESEDALETFAVESPLAFPHPVDAAESLVEAGIGDATEFVAQTLSASGHAWPARCSMRSLYDDLGGRATPERRLRMLSHFDVIGAPGRPLQRALRAGDLIVRRSEGGLAHGAFVAHPLLYREDQAREHGLLLEGPWSGLYAHVVEAGVRPQHVSTRFARRVGHADGTVLDDTLIVRPRAPQDSETRWLESDEAAPDPNVRWLQGTLNRAINAGLAVDGLLGPLTRAAVRNYQGARGLQVDGIVGPQTLAALRAEGYSPPSGYGYAPAYPEPPSYPTPPYPTTPPGYEVPPTPYTPPAPPRYETPPPPPQPPRYETPPPPYTPPRPPVYRPPQPPRYETPRPPYTPPRPPVYRPPQPPRYETPRPPYTPPRPPVYRPPQRPPSYEEPGYAPDANDAFGTCRALDRFGYDSAVLTADHRTAIGELAQRMLANRSTAATVTGFASPEGTASYNLALGQRRADAVVAELRQSLERARAGSGASIALTARSEGEARQVSSDAGANRRVEVCYNEGPPPRPQPRPRPRPRPASTLVRYDVATTQGRAMLQRYEEAVRRMMALPTSNPLSWTFQWNIHAVRGDTDKARELTSVFGATPSATRTLADRTWGTCRPHFNDADERFFLVWHRIYLYYFERICRRVLGDDTFTLPYWDYSNGPSELPAPFRNPASPLYRRDRNANANRGDPLRDPRVPTMFSPRSALAQTRFSSPTDDTTGFNDLVELNPHNAIHGAIGDGRGMGSVAWAAGDPIFWLHHCNIDRLWASWNGAGRRNPSDAAWLNSRFTFADENGAQVDALASEYTGTQARGYRYDRLEAVPAPGSSGEDVEANEPTPRRRAMATRSTAAPTGGIPLGGNAIKVTLGRPVRDSGESDEAAPQARRTYLVLRNYRANVDPGVLYYVYLSLPPGTTGASAQRHFVGPLSFFGVTPMPGHGHGGGRNARFDVTDIVRRLRAAGRFEGTPSVTLVPASQPNAAAQPIIGEISLVEK